ncbi:type VII secretion target [Actinoplanes sp. CA-252034]|uniref:type VII secretion target n=1 Tax=Actinoplanes sp. CA-252034 TaxID=3239906 RepID=UPI003D974801
MSQPTSGEVHIACEALRRESVQWDSQGERLRIVSATAAEFEFNRVEAGLFQVMVGAYNDVINAVSARCSEGATAMAEVAATLRRAADVYEAEDRAGEHRIRNIY